MENKINETNKTNKTNKREAFDETFKHMVNSDAYKTKYMFYAYFVNQCNIIFDYNMEFIAGVRYNITSYELLINPVMFAELPLRKRLGVIKHEMLHIMNNHIQRATYINELDHKIWNIATDCAINQLIDVLDLPENHISLNYMKSVLGPQLESKQSGEYYYKQYIEDIDNNNGCDVNKPESFDTHDWEVIGNEDFRKSKTKQMIENAMKETINNRGDLPNKFDKMIELFEVDSTINWQEEIKNITGNKRVNKTHTIKKRSRRFPNRYDIYGTIKDRVCDIVVVLDVSGSMEDEDINYGLNEIREICRLTDSSIKIIQVDTEVHEVDDFETTTTEFNRKGSGGTYIYPAVKYIVDKDINHDLIVVITDGFIEDVSQWEYQPEYVYYLLTEDNNISGIVNPNHKQFNLKEEKE
jgi:predicted metal-dependent peptidase